MKKLINGKLYDTETAEEIYTSDNGIYGNDFRRYSETLYRTKKGVFFLYGEGGPLSKYAVNHGNSTSGGSDITVLSNIEAFEWLQENQAIEKIQELFPDEIEEG